MRDKVYNENVDCLHDQFDNGEVTFGIYLATDVGEPADLEEAIEMWADGADVEMNFRFSVTGCIDSLLDGIQTNRHRPHTGILVFESERSKLAALRAELVAAIEKLDSVAFEPDTKEHLAIRKAYEAQRMGETK